jgi:hypothetical protein
MAGMLGFKVVTQYERGIVFRWGRVSVPCRERRLSRPDADLHEA